MDETRPAFPSFCRIAKRRRGKKKRKTRLWLVRGEGADGEEDAETGACYNQRSRVDCRPPGNRRDADRLHPSTCRTKNEGMERLFRWKEGPCFSPGPLVRQIKGLTLAIGLSPSHTSALSFFLSFFYTFPSQSLCLSSRSVCLYQGSPLTDTPLSRFISPLSPSFSVSFFYLHLEKIRLVVIEPSSHTRRHQVHRLFFFSSSP